MARKKAVKKEVVKKLSATKKTINVVKTWLEANGIEGILGLIAVLLLWAFGYKIYAGFAFGLFATRNGDLVKSWVKGLLSK